MSDEEKKNGEYEKPESHEMGGNDLEDISGGTGGRVVGPVVAEVPPPPDIVKPAHMPVQYVKPAMLRGRSVGPALRGVSRLCSTVARKTKRHICINESSGEIGC